MAETRKESTAGLRIALIEKAEELTQAFDCAAAAFGRQTKDGIWMAMSPGWDTPKGRTNAITRSIRRWEKTTTDNNGRPNTMHLKAALLDDNGLEQVVGLAVWLQVSAVEGHGDVVPNEMMMQENARGLYPDNETEQRYLFQLDRSLHQRRGEVVQSKATMSQPSAMVLDFCVVHPSQQGRGIAKAMVQWGLEEAQRRGGLEAITEASSMGRRVYEKLGFCEEGSEIEYTVDTEFADRVRPSNIFMRTQGAGK